MQVTACLVALWGALLLACDAPTGVGAVSAAPARSDDDPIRIRVGAREVQVQCAFGCEDARREMSAQQRQCVNDPMSTPRHVTDHASWIALGCCTEAARIYREACGLETLEACASRWIAECESGR